MTAGTGLVLERKPGESIIVKTPDGKRLRVDILQAGVVRFVAKRDEFIIFAARRRERRQEVRHGQG